MIRKLIFALVILTISAFGQTAPFNVLNQPAVTNRPYKNAYYNQRLLNAGTGGPGGHLMAGSASIVSTIGTNFFTGPVHTPGSDDFASFPIYWGQSTDLLFTITGCGGNSTGTAINGSTFHAGASLPFNGYPGSTSDSNLILYDQTNQRTEQFYGGSSVPNPQLPAVAGNFNHFGNIYCNQDNWATGKGYQSGSGITGGSSPAGQTVTFKELASGHIYHALYGYSLCSGSANNLYTHFVVFPIGPGGGSPGQLCTSSTSPPSTDVNRPPNGALFYLDYTNAQLDCLNPAKAACGGINKLGKYQFAYVEATTNYGVYLGGTGNGDALAVPSTESGTSYYWLQTHGFSGAKAIADAYFAEVAAECVSPCTHVTRSGGPWPNAAAPHSTDQWNTAWWANISTIAGQGFFGHMHIADPCVTAGLQGVTGGTDGAPTPCVGKAVITITGTGTISSSDPGNFLCLSGTNYCTAIAENSTSITFTASGANSASWTGACTSSTSTCTVTLNGTTGQKNIAVTLSGSGPPPPPGLNVYVSSIGTGTACTLAAPCTEAQGYTNLPATATQQETLHYANGTYANAITISKSGQSSSTRLRVWCDNGVASATAAAGKCVKNGTGVAFTIMGANVDLQGFDLGGNNSMSACIVSGSGSNSFHALGNYCHNLGSAIVNSSSVTGCPANGAITMGSTSVLTDQQAAGNIILTYGSGYPSPSCLTAQGILIGSGSGQLYNNLIVNVPYSGIQMTAPCSMRVSNNVIISSLQSITLSSANVAAACSGGVIGKNTIANNWFGNHGRSVYLLTDSSGGPDCTSASLNLYTGNVSDGVGNDFLTSAGGATPFSCDTVNPQPSTGAFTHQAGAAFFVNYQTSSLGDYHLLP